MAGDRKDITHEDIMARLERGDERFREIAKLLEELPEMRSDLKANTAAIKRMAEIQDAWITIKGTGNSIIWLGKVLGGLLVILASLGAIVKFQLWAIIGKAGQ